MKPTTSERKKLEVWWIKTNGTGTDACSTCKPPHICTWHGARLDELADLIIQEKATAREEQIMQDYFAYSEAIDDSEDRFIEIRDAQLAALEKGQTDGDT